MTPKIQPTVEVTAIQDEMRELEPLVKEEIVALMESDPELVILSIEDHLKAGFEVRLFTNLTEPPVVTEETARKVSEESRKAYREHLRANGIDPKADAKRQSRRAKEMQRKAKIQEIETQPKASPFDAISNLEVVKKAMVRAQIIKVRVQVQSLKRKAKDLAHDGETTKAKDVMDLAFEIEDTMTPMDPNKVRAILYS